MKKRILSLLLFLLTTLWATASSVTFRWYNFYTKSWETQTRELGHSNWSQDVKWETSNPPIMTWNAAELKLDISNYSNFESFSVVVDNGITVTINSNYMRVGQFNIQGDVVFTSGRDYARLGVN